MREIDWKQVIEEREMKIRTRGALQQRETTQIRTRGSIRTRGGTPPGGRETKGLDELFAELRGKAQGSPLALVTLGWDEEPALTWVQKAALRLVEDDASWLIPGKADSSSVAPPELSDAVVLNLDDDTDGRVYNNIVVDIVFFPDGEAKRVDQWQSRAEVIVISSAAQRFNQLAEHARQSQMECYSWSDSEPDMLVRL